MRLLYDRFATATRLCTGPEPIKTRLNFAWLEQLDGIQPADMPESLQQEFRALRRAMHAVKPLPDEPHATAAIRKMSASQAAQHARTILKVATELHALCLSHERPSDTDSQQLVFDRDLTAPKRLN